MQAPILWRSASTVHLAAGIHRGHRVQSPHLRDEGTEAQRGSHEAETFDQFEDSGL